MATKRGGLNRKKLSIADHAKACYSMLTFKYKEHSFKWDSGKSGDCYDLIKPNTNFNLVEEDEEYKVIKMEIQVKIKREWIKEMKELEETLAVPKKTDFPLQLNVISVHKKEPQRPKHPQRNTIKPRKTNRNTNKAENDSEDKKAYHTPLTPKTTTNAHCLSRRRYNSNRTEHRSKPLQLKTNYARPFNSSKSHRSLPKRDSKQPNTVNNRNKQRNERSGIEYDKYKQRYIRHDTYTTLRGSRMPRDIIDDKVEKNLNKRYKKRVSLDALTKSHSKQSPSNDLLRNCPILTPQQLWHKNATPKHLQKRISMLRTYKTDPKSPKSPNDIEDDGGDSAEDDNQ